MVTNELQCTILYFIAFVCETMFNQIPGSMSERDLCKYSSMNITSYHSNHKYFSPAD